MTHDDEWWLMMMNDDKFLGLVRGNVDASVNASLPLQGVLRLAYAACSCHEAVPTRWRNLEKMS